MVGTVAILNVGTGDTKLIFDKNNPAETIRAARIVKDMLRRGYALLIEVTQPDRTKVNRRVYDFDEAVCEYIIADFDPMVAKEADAEEESTHEEAEQEGIAAKPATKRRPVKTKRVPAEGTSVVAIGRTAGG